MLTVSKLILSCMPEQKPLKMRLRHIDLKQHLTRMVSVMSAVYGTFCSKKVLLLLCLLKHLTEATVSKVLRVKVGRSRLIGSSCHAR